MKTQQLSEVPPAFLQTAARALTNLKVRLQHDYQQAYPDLAEIIHLVLDEEETRARELTIFPHLFLPDLVEAHIAKLNLQPAENKHDNVFVPRRLTEIPTYQPAFAL